MVMLISLGAIKEAMEISIHFMDKASHQIESSDEGMMLAEVEECLEPILSYLEDFDETQRADWAFRMQTADRGWLSSATINSVRGLRLRETNRL
jgi:hypothetical protein